VRDGGFKARRVAPCKRVHLRCSAQRHPRFAFRWAILDGRGLGLEVPGEGPRPALRIRAGAPLGVEASVEVITCEGERELRARASVVSSLPDEALGGHGIPEPALLSDTAGRWRSRMSGALWEVNDAHEDYVALRAEPRSRLRYLLSLLAKEIALQHSAATGGSRCARVARGDSRACGAQLGAEVNRNRRWQRQRRGR
jgi:hypothetical protein